MTPFWPRDISSFLMGVINLTPDSFSDGGVHQNARVLQEKLKSWSSHKNIFPDFGAQSTAPKNEPISLEQEWHRLQLFFELNIDSIFEQFSCLSFDTYRPQTMRSILEHPQIQRFKGKLIWNDVSGHFDDQVYDLLLNYDNLYYVYTHNAVHTRELTPRHREFSSLFTPDSIFESVLREFSGVLGELDESLQEKVILDPGFGFAKDPETSVQLLQDLPDLIHHFSQKQGWLIGLSRKSVLQKVKGSKNWDELDKLQEGQLKKLVSKCPEHHFIFRVHDPLPLTDSLL